MDMKTAAKALQALHTLQVPLDTSGCSRRGSEGKVVTLQCLLFVLTWPGVVQSISFIFFFVHQLGAWCQL